jgi:hypothetical protein
MVKPLDIKTCWGFESSEIYLTTLPRRPYRLPVPVST